MLLLSGPCALGVSINEALGRSSLDKLEFGLIEDDRTRRSVEDVGEAIILVADKGDLGAFRLSDPRKNFIVASTELKDLARMPRSPHWEYRITKVFQVMRRSGEALRYTRTTE